MNTKLSNLIIFSFIILNTVSITPSEMTSQTHSLSSTLPPIITLLCIYDADGNKVRLERTTYTITKLSDKDPSLLNPVERMIFKYYTPSKNHSPRKKTKNIKHPSPIRITTPYFLPQHEINTTRTELEKAMFGKRLPREERYTSKRSPRDTWSKKQQGKRNNGHKPYSDRPSYNGFRR